MRFLTAAECDEWMVLRPAEPPSHTLSIRLPHESGRLLFIARNIVHSIMFRQPCLLRATEWDIWSSNNNWHLYYRLRQSYGDRQLIDDAPGCLFLDYEAEDLATFLHLAMLFGWDSDLRPEAPYVWGKLSHDGFLDLNSSDPTQMTSIRDAMQSAKIEATLGQSPL